MLLSWRSTPAIVASNNGCWGSAAWCVCVGPFRAPAAGRCRERWRCQGGVRLSARVAGEETSAGPTQRSRGPWLRQASGSVGGVCCADALVLSEAASVYDARRVCDVLRILPIHATPTGTDWPATVCASTATCLTIAATMSLSRSGALPPHDEDGQQIRMSRPDIPDYLHPTQRLRLRRHEATPTVPTQVSAQPCTITMSTLPTFRRQAAPLRSEFVVVCTCSNQLSYVCVFG